MMIALTYEEIKEILKNSHAFEDYHFRGVENRGLQSKMADLVNNYRVKCKNWDIATCWHFSGVDLGIFYIGG